MADQRYEYQRLPATEKQISSITSSDQKVKVLGTILSKESDSIVLDDGTGAVKIALSPDDHAKVSEQELVRVTGRVVKSVNGFILQGDVVEKKEGLNTKLYKRVFSLWQNFVHQV